MKSLAQSHCSKCYSRNLNSGSQSRPARLTSSHTVHTTSACPTTPASHVCSGQLGGSLEAMTMTFVEMAAPVSPGGHDNGLTALLSRQLRSGP